VQIIYFRFVADPIADELEIRNLLARVAQLADSGDIDEYMACYTRDAVWSMPANPANGLPASTKEGHDDIRAGVVERRAGGVQGPGSNTRHVVTTSTVTVSGDTATGTSYFMFMSGAAIQSVGQYDDRFVRGEDGWMVAHRTIVIG